MNQEELYLQTVYWKDIRDKVFATNPDFARLVDELDPGKDYPLYLAKYRYGDVIVDRGVCRLPTPETGKLVLEADNEIPLDIQKGLEYCAPKFPAGIVLDNSIQICLTPKIASYMPWFRYKKGTIFALWKYLHPKMTYHPAKIFTITAGANPILMTPPICDANFHKYLRLKYGLSNLPLPKTLADHWLIFKAIVNTKAAKCDWSLPLLYFSNNWVKKFSGDDPVWLKISHYLFKRVYIHSDFWRNKKYIDYAFSCAQANRNLRPNPYIVDTAKHLFMLSLGEADGFVPAIDNDAAPIDLLQKIYLEDYGLRRYIPTIFVSDSFSLQNERPVYYSLTHPTTLEFSPKARKFENHIYDLRELKHVMGRIIDEIKSGRLGFEDTPIIDTIGKVKFDYFHIRKDIFYEIRMTKEMANEDPNLTKTLVPTKNKLFAYTGEFVRSCVRVSVV
ncbi:MAG: hypothetical protein M1561_04705 [Gammaproteobacteria bacterium]|nr:hypothetical protein [Gammaproteobacteria bacterium]